MALGMDIIATTQIATAYFPVHATPLPCCLCHFTATRDERDEVAGEGAETMPTGKSQVHTARHRATIKASEQSLWSKKIEMRTGRAWKHARPIAWAADARDLQTATLISITSNARYTHRNSPIITL
jgi:hypothetical protein